MEKKKKKSTFTNWNKEIKTMQSEKWGLSFKIF